MTINWTQEQRLRYIDRSLFWMRSISAKQIVDAFSVTRQSAQADLALYREMAGKDAFKYSQEARQHIPTTSFKPIFNESPIGFAEKGGLEDFSSRMVFSTPPVERYVMPELIPAILAAIDGNLDIEAVYASGTFPEGKERRLSPSALMFCMNRFHVRAYCYERKEYRDYVLSRFLTAPSLVESKGAPKDSEVDKWITVSLMPNPFLNQHETKMIEREYGLDGRKEVTVRKCLINYFLRENCLPSSEDQLRESRENPLSFPVIAHSAVDFF